MGRVYVRKSDRAKSYTKQDLERAMNEVRSGTITTYKASEKYRIPKMTELSSKAQKAELKEEVRQFFWKRKTN